MMDQSRIDRIAESRAKRNGTVNTGSVYNGIDENRLVKLRERRLQAEQERLQEMQQTAQQQSISPEKQQITSQQPQEKEDLFDKAKSFVRGIIETPTTFTEEEMKEADPTFKETMSALTKYPAKQMDDILTVAGDVLFGNEAERLRKRGVPEEKVQQFEKNMQDYHAQYEAKTAGEANVFRKADYATLITPVAKTGAVTRTTGKAVEAAVKVGASPKTINAIIKHGGDLDKVASLTKNKAIIDDVARLQKEDTITESIAALGEPKMTSTQQVKSAELQESASVRAGVLERSKILEERMKNASTPNVRERLQTEMNQVDEWAKKIDDKNLEEGELNWMREELMMHGIDTGAIAKKAPHLEGKTLTEAMEGKAPADLPIPKKKVSEEVNELMTNTQGGANVYSEMDMAAAGKRAYRYDDQARDAQHVFEAEASTFPDWVSPDLRSRDLFDKVQKHAMDGTMPKTVRQKRLYEEMVLESAAREGKDVKAIKAEFNRKAIKVKADVKKQEVKVNVKSVEDLKKKAVTKQVQKMEADEAFDFEAHTKQTIATREAARKGQKKSLWIRTKDRFSSDAFESQYRVEKEYDNFEKLYGKKVSENADYRMQHTKVPRATEIASDFLEENGFNDVLKSLKNEHNSDKFSLYMQAKHTLDRAAKGDIRATGTAVQDAINIVKSVGDEFAEQAQGMKKFTHKLLDYLVDTGIKSKDDVAFLKADNPHYVPLNRIFDDEELKVMGETFGKGAKTRAGLADQSIIQTRKGSERAVEDMFVSLRDKTMQAHLQGERNKAARMIADTKKFMPENPFALQKVKNTTKPTDATLTFFRDGKKEVWKIDPDIKRSLAHLDSRDIGTIGQIMAMPVRVFKLGTTGIKASFILPNIAVDQASAFINADHGLAGSPLNIVNFTQSVASIFKHDDIYKAIRKEGGLYTSYDYWRNAGIKDNAAIMADRNIGSKITHVAKNPKEWLRAIEDIASKSEELTRAQYSRAEYKVQIKKGKTPEQAAKIAAKTFREVTVDFMRSGNASKAANSAIPYFNPQIQGARTLMRNLKKKPVATTTKILATIMLPATYITAHNLSDPKRREAYMALPEWERDNNIIYIPDNPTQDESGKWNVVKVKIPPEVAALVRPIRQTHEMLAGIEPVEFKDYAGAMLQVGTGFELTDPYKVAGSIIPQALKPSVEVMTNKNLFTKAPIVPEQMAQWSPEMQIYNNVTSKGKPRTPTSGTVSKIAGKVGLSPIATEHWITQSFGGVSKNVINWVDTATAKMGLIEEDEVGGINVRDDVARRFTKAYGGADTAKYYEERSAKIKEFSKIPEGAERTMAIQEYVATLNNDDRKGAMFAISGAGISTKGVTQSQDVIDIMPVFNQAQKLKAAGDIAGAQKIVEGLSDEDYAKYKKATSTKKRAETAQQKKVMEPAVEQIQKLKADGKTDQAKRMVEQMSDEQYEIYKKTKTSLGY